MKLSLKLLFKYTFVDYCREFFRKKDKFYLYNVKKYWKSSENVSNKEEKVILVECLEKPNLDWNVIYSFTSVLSQMYKTKVIALVSYSSCTDTPQMLSNYHNISKIEAVYKFFDIKTKLKALFLFIKQIPLTYNLQYGFQVFVEDVDIGDLVYDEYLRIAKVETCRKPTLSFYILMYNSIYQHLRYIDIITNNKITDIVAIRDTYSHASFYRVKENITIWKNISTPNRAIIGQMRSNKKFNFKPQYFKIEHLEYIKNNYSRKEILSIYNDILLKRKTGNIKDSIDAKEMKLAHSNHDINTEKEFYNNYSINKDKKTIIIYAHVFVDAVRYCHHTIFSDYYTWLIETCLYFVRNKDVNILVKPHPSEVLYELGKNVKDVIDEFNLKYHSKVILLEKKINVDVIYNVSDIIVTGSGTIGLEAPCIGMKVITAGSTMYENTGATFSSSSQKEYFELLKNFENLPDLSEKEKFNSIVGFIWMNELIYAKSRLFKDLNVTTDINKKQQLLNEIYKNASLKELEIIKNKMIYNYLN